MFFEKIFFVDFKSFQRMQRELQKGEDEVAKREVREKEIMATEKKREEE